VVEDVDAIGEIGHRSPVPGKPHRRKLRAMPAAGKQR
jgi:hypothetical protein